MAGKDYYEELVEKKNQELISKDDNKKAKKK